MRGTMHRLVAEAAWEAQRQVPMADEREAVIFLAATEEEEEGQEAAIHLCRSRLAGNRTNLYRSPFLEACTCARPTRRRRRSSCTP